MIPQYQHGLNGNPGIYGSTAPPKLRLQKKSPFSPGDEGPDIVKIVLGAINLFLPWILFCIVFWTMSFSMHYKDAHTCYLIVFVGLAFVGFTGCVAFDAIKNDRVAPKEANWPVFLFVSCFVAWALAVVAGDVNFGKNLMPFYDVNNLNTYPSVDPAITLGQQLMDAGQVTFTPNTRIDASRAMAFKTSEQFCVAPIVSGNGTHPSGIYDLWAVGMNCCSGRSGDFDCGTVNNASAPAALRLMADNERSFFRLAVQKAEAVYNVKANHPLFFVWTNNPAAEVSAYMDEGFKFFIMGSFFYFLLQIILVTAVCMAPPIVKA